MAELKKTEWLAGDFFARVWTKGSCQGRDLTFGETIELGESGIDSLHRVDGPALEFSNGDCEYWLDGNFLPTEQVQAWLEQNGVDLSTSSGQLAFLLTWTGTVGLNKES